MPLKLDIAPNRKTSGLAAAKHAAKLLRQTLKEKGSASIIVATGASQFDTLEAFLQEPDIAWENVTAFHLDEYVGIAITHPASFRKYLWERFHQKLPLPLKAFHYIDGTGDAQAECKRLGNIIAQHPIDICFAGIGENSHLAFNDPPADFQTEAPYLVVNLDEACRRQQLGEGWFPNLDAVPKQAISMSIRQIMKSKTLIITVPDERKAAAVQKTVEGPVTPMVPASIMQQHADVTLYLDAPAASLLKK